MYITEQDEKQAACLYDRLIPLIVETANIIQLYNYFWPEPSHHIAQDQGQAAEADEDQKGGP